MYDDDSHNDDALLKFDMPEVIFGAGALHKIGECAKRLGGERVFVVTDPGVIAVGWLDEALKHLEREGLKCVVYSNVVTNPRDFQVHAGAQLYLQKQCDVIVAVGGGSPIDTGKGVAILVSNHGNIHDFEGCNRVMQPLPPMVCAPTTAGTGADVTQFAVVTDTVRKVKMTILSRAIMPDISLIDPRLLQTKPAELIAATGMDTLTHAIEAYVSSLSWPLTDPHAFHAVELTFRHLPAAVHEGSLPALTGMSIACLEAGIAFSNAILGAVHALAHPLGGLYDVHHGLANSILLPVVIRRNLEHSLEKYANLAKATGAYRPEMSPREAALSLVESIEKLVAEIGLPNRLSQLGVRKEDLTPMAVLAQQDVCLFTNPCPYNAQELAALYLEAW
uniref:iron-containing alcohol dehydrogenase n=1 Tax=Desulfobacca sp. TaxID=2067990 RepID=UPI0040497CC2